MASPAFTINGEYDAAVTAGGAVVATLDDISGVDLVQWDVISTEPTTDIGNYILVTSGPKGSTVSTTALTAGTAGIIRCRINGGLDRATGAVDPIGTTATRKFYVETDNGLEVICAGETTEADPVAGWSAIVNRAIRAGFGGSINDAQHGNRSGGSLHALATTSTAGFMSAADKTSLVNATDQPTGSTLFLRDVNGGGSIATLVASRIDLGNAPSDAGSIRLSEGQGVYAPSMGSGHRRLIEATPGDTVTVGDDGEVASIDYRVSASGSHDFYVDSTLVASLDADHRAVTTQTISEELDGPYQDAIVLLGTSLFAGSGASADDATGPREAFFQELRRYGFSFRFVGPHSYGALNSTGTTWGRFHDAGDFHNIDAPPPLGFWEHHGEAGRRMTYSVTVTAVNDSTDTLTAPGHLLANGSIVVLSSSGSVPSISPAQDYYFAVNVSGDDFQLSAYDGGSAADITDVGSGTISIGTGLLELVPATFPALAAPPTTVILQAGTNDISELIDAAALDPLTTLQGRFQALVAAVASESPSALRYLIAGVFPFYSGATNYAAKAALASDFNNWLQSYVPTLGSEYAFVDVAAGLEGPLFQSDGVHPRRSGGALFAKNLANAYALAMGGAVYGRPVPRRPTRRTAQACVNMTGTSNQIAFPDQASIRPGSDNALWAVWFRPTTVATGFAVIAQHNNPYTDGLAILRSGPNVLVYFLAAPPVIPATPYNAVLRQDGWHRLMVVVDHDAAQVALFCNGRLAQTVNITDADVSVNGSFYLGSIGGLDAALGQYQNLLFARGADITIGSALEIAERDYYDNQDPPGVSAKYDLAEGTGTTVAGTAPGATAGTITGATWASAGQYPRIVDDGFLPPGDTIEFPANVSPRVMQTANSTASATGKTLAVSGQNCTGTGSTGGSVSISAGTGAAADGTITVVVGGTTRLEADGTGLGFFGVAPVARPAAYTQTYSTATRTLGAYTADDESTPYTPVNILGNDVAAEDDVNALRAAYENLRALTENLAGLVNAMLDDLQSLGILQ